ncbi:MAG: hypothetical protein OEL54_03520 [Flavobacteriaceae bacterium]|nr:hypothetical protein [Flavobacteriaceae bacterium]
MGFFDKIGNFFEETVYKDFLRDTVYEGGIEPVASKIIDVGEASLDTSIKVIESIGNVAEDTSDIFSNIGDMIPLILLGGGLIAYKVLSK